MSRLTGEINAAKSALSFRGEYRAGIVSNLGRIADKCAESAKNMLAMGNALGQVLDKYEKTETKIAERVSGTLKLKNYTVDVNGNVIGGLPLGIEGINIGIESMPGYTYASASASAAWYQDGKFNPYAKAEAQAGFIGKSGKVEAGYKGIEAEASYTAGYGSADAEAEINLMRNGYLGPNGKAEANAEFGVVKGNVKVEGKYGRSELTGAIRSAGAHAGIAFATTDEDGRFSPSVKAEAEAKASVASGSFEGRLGTDTFNAHGEASGALLGAEAEAGIAVSEHEIKAKAGAEAYLAKGEVKGGYTICGIQVDLKLEGKAGALGADADFEASDTAVKFGVGLSALLGVGVEASIDWSEFELPDFDSDSLW